MSNKQQWFNYVLVGLGVLVIGVWGMSWWVGQGDDGDGAAEVVAPRVQDVGDRDAIGVTDGDGEAEVVVSAGEKVRGDLGGADGGVPASFLPVMGTASGLQFSEQSGWAGVAWRHETPIVEGDGAEMISGATVGDFDNDGWQDLYVIGGGVERDALFMNNGDGTFRDGTVAAGLAELHLGSGAAAADYDNDGWLDLFVTSFGREEDMGPGRQRLYHNNGDGTFTDVAIAAGVYLTSPKLADGLGAAFGDYDLDGDLDLFVAGWRKPGGEPAKGNRLFMNNGDGTFTDVTVAAGIVDEGIRGFSPCFADMDGDWYPELLLAADFGTSRYWRNNGDGTFTDMTIAAGTSEAWSGMGATVADVNGDGLLDWYVTAIFEDNHDGRGDGSKMYINQGGHQYIEKANEMGIDDGGWGWGTVVVDFDHDGFVDVAAVNGWGLVPYHNEAMKLWLNQGDGTFADVAGVAGLGAQQNELGLLNFDYDGDGDQDLVTTGYQRPLTLYRNDLDRPNQHWLRVKLVTTGTDLAPDGWGSRVIVEAGGKRHYRQVTGCSHYLTQSELPVHVGLGATAVVDRLTVQWPDGTVTVLEDVAANQTVVVTRN